MNAQTTHPNAVEIAELFDARQWKLLEIERIRQQLARAEAELKSLGEVMEYLGGKCPNCAEYGLICLDSDGFCQFC